MSDNHDDLLGEPTPPPTPIVSSAVNYPTVYADSCIFATRLGSTVRLTFVEHILEPANGPSPGMKTRHVGTLVMPYEGYKNMLEYLTNQASQFIDLPDHADGK